MRNEQEVLRHKVIRKGLNPETPVWYRGKRSGSWAFVCGVCGEVCYYPQNTHAKEENRRVVMGYRYCPYCRTEMKGIAIERVNAGRPLPKQGAGAVVSR